MVCMFALPCTGVLAAGFVQQRKVKEFDFDERDKGNYEDLPMDWYAIGRDPLSSDPNFGRKSLHVELTGRPGFPKYNAVGFDSNHKTSGKESLYLELSGGNAGAFVEVGAIPAVPNSDYMLTVRVRTTRLKDARACFTGYFVNNAGERIEASVKRSEPVTTDGQWSKLTLRLLGEFADAAYIGMQLELLQATADPDSPLGEHQLVYEQVHGGAWFDDVVVWQLPGVSMTTQSAVNVILAPQEPKLTVKVRDLTGRPLVCDMVVYDLDRRPIAGDRRHVGAGAPTSWQWLLPLERHGWYLIDLHLYETQTAADVGKTPPVARAITSLLWLGRQRRLDVDSASRFVIAAERIDQEQMALLPELLEQCRLGAVTLSGWERHTTPATLERQQVALEGIVGPMLTDGHHVSLAISPLPEALTGPLDLDQHGAISLFGRPRTAWYPMLAPVLLRHGQRVRQWQLGSIDAADAFLLPDLPGALDAALKQIEGLAPDPRPIVPWRLDQERRSGVSDQFRYVIDVPHAVNPENFAQYMEQWSTSPPTDVRLHLREPPADQVSQRQRVEGMAMRMLYGWEAGAAGLAVSRPWTRSDERHLTLLPDPLLGVFASVAHRLAGRRVVGRLGLAKGVECMILDGPAGGMLAAWNKCAASDEAVIDMYLGPNPQAVDVWGNRKDVPLVDNRHRWQLTEMPVFLEGIDPELALFRSAFKLDEPFIESLQIPHERNVTLRNYWPSTISGFMYITGPKRWRIRPQRRFFSIASGEISQIPLKMVFPVSELAGAKRLTARFDFTAEQRYQIELSTAMELGMKDVGFDAGVTVEPSADGLQKDLVVTELITNHSTEVLAIHAFANLPGFPRQERSVPVLQPGQSIVQRFRFGGGGALGPQEAIRVGLRQTRGAAVINKVLSLEEADRR